MHAPDYNILEGVGELNLGQTATLVPSPVVGFAGQEEKLILIPDRANAGRSQAITIHVASFTPRLNGNPNGIPVGAIEFSGGGAKLGRIEFDIPVSRPFPPTWSATTSARRGLNNGVSVSIIAGGVQVFARNDGNIAFLTDPTTGISPGNNVEVSAHVGRYPLGRNDNLRRTVFIAGGAGGALAPAAAVTFGIPNYARSVWFPRAPMAQALEITIAGTGSAASVFTVPAGALYPTPDSQPIPISPDDFTMTVRNIGAADITSLKAVFALEL